MQQQMYPQQVNQKKPNRFHAKQSIHSYAKSFLSILALIILASTLWFFIVQASVTTLLIFLILFAVCYIGYLAYVVLVLLVVKKKSQIEVIQEQDTWKELNLPHIHTITVSKQTSLKEPVFVIDKTTAFEDAAEILREYDIRFKQENACESLLPWVKKQKFFEYSLEGKYSSYSKDVFDIVTKKKKRRSIVAVVKADVWFQNRLIAKVQFDWITFKYVLTVYDKASQIGRNV